MALEVYEKVYGMEFYTRYGFVQSQQPVPRVKLKRFRLKTVALLVCKAQFGTARKLLGWTPVRYRRAGWLNCTGCST